MSFRFPDSGFRHVLNFAYKECSRNKVMKIESVDGPILRLHAN